MKLMGTSGVTAAAALFAGLLMTSAVGAAPLASSQAVGQQANSQSEPMLQSVRDRGGRHQGGWRGHRHHRGWGGAGWGAAAAAGLLLGAPLLSDGYGPAYGYGYDDDDDDVVYRGRQYSGGGEARCEATFRSYDPSSGTYMGYDGVRRACPYL